VLERADVGPGQLVGVDFEVLVAERLQAGQNRVDLDFLRTNGRM
jgi:hypothetical protein